MAGDGALRDGLSAKVIQLSFGPRDWLLHKGISWSAGPESGS
jgi:hypothetical protein